MRRQSVLRAGAFVAGLTLAISAGCSRRDDDRTITAAPERASASTRDARLPPAPVTSAADASALNANPLEMKLKHDGPPPTATAAPTDPCAVTPRTGPLAMPLRHEGSNEPNPRNPLCMPLK